MSRRKRYRPKPTRRDLARILLDQFSASDIEKWSEFQNSVLRFHWDYYNSLAYQRSQITDSLSKALAETAETSFQFSKWQRVVKYRYALEPLSAAGSLVDPGGRFNIGEINPAQFPPFPALYLAADKHTALQEALSQKITQGQESKALNVALAKPDSVAMVSVSGVLDSVINLKNPASLGSFVGLFKDFSVPDSLITAAKALGFPPPELVYSTTKLMEAVLDPNWRLWPMQFDVPVTSQIFGQLVAQAGIQAVLHTSKFSDGDCLAVFPQNFENSEAFIALDDPTPSKLRIRRLDASTWQHLV